MGEMHPPWSRTLSIFRALSASLQRNLKEFNQRELPYLQQLEHWCSIHLQRRLMHSQTRIHTQIERETRNRERKEKRERECVCVCVCVCVCTERMTYLYLLWLKQSQVEELSHLVVVLSWPTYEPFNALHWCFLLMSCRLLQWGSACLEYLLFPIEGNCFSLGLGLKMAAW